MATRSYHCGEGGIVQRQDNLTGPWLVKNVPNQQLILNDIMTSPMNGDLVFTVGSNNGIFRSIDAGDNWTVPGGGYLSFPATVWYEVWVIDNNNIVVCGSEGRIAVSTDGGLNFGILSNLPTPTGFPVPGTAARAIHFTTPLIGVVGFEDRVYKTIDGGSTWTLGTPLVISPSQSAPSRPPVINGIHLDQTGQVIVVHGDTNIWRSTDGGLTFIPVYNYVHTLFVFPSNIFIYNGKHLTWYDDSNLWGTGDYEEMVRSTNGGATWTLLRTNFTIPAPLYSSNNAAHFYQLLTGTADGFWNNNNILNSTSDSGLTGTPSDTSPVIINAVWTQLEFQQCYKLLNCGGKPIPIISNDDLAQYVGSVVQIEDQCFEVELSEDCQGAVTLFPNGVPPLPTFPNCITCNPPQCFLLEDCSGVNPSITTSTDLSGYVGQVIKLCDIESILNVPITHTSLINCSPFLGTEGFITEVTNLSSGFYYDIVSDTVLPYTNPGFFVVVPGQGGCFLNGAITSTDSTIICHFIVYVDGTSITTPIPISDVMPPQVLQYLTDQNTVDSNFKITIDSFDANGLVITITALSPTAGSQILVVLDCPNAESSVTSTITKVCICYKVSSLGPCVESVPLEQVIDGCFPDCECCIGPPPPEPDPPYIPTPPEIDKHTYHIPESECDILANQTFANAMYSLFREKQYGIESCCPKNFNQIWIKKQLSDFSKIKC